MKPSEKANWLVSIPPILLGLAWLIERTVPDAARLLPKLQPYLPYIVVFGIICANAGNLIAAHIGKSRAEEVKEEVSGAAEWQLPPGETFVRGEDEGPE